MPTHIYTVPKVRRLQTSARQVEDRLSALLAEVTDNKILGVALVVQYVDGCMSAWNSQTGPNHADRFKMVGALNYLANRMCSDIEETKDG